MVDAGPDLALFTALPFPGLSPIKELEAVPPLDLCRVAKVTLIKEGFNCGPAALDSASRVHFLKMRGNPTRHPGFPLRRIPPYRPLLCCSLGFKLAGLACVSGYRMPER